MQGLIDTAFIIRAVNAHDALVETVEQFINIWPMPEGRIEPKATPEVINVWRQARAALKLAKGGD